MAAACVHLQAALSASGELAVRLGELCALAKCMYCPQLLIVQYLPLALKRWLCMPHDSRSN